MTTKRSIKNIKLKQEFRHVELPNVTDFHYSLSMNYE